jgi:hypothetical protein
LHGAGGLGGERARNTGLVVNQAVGEEAVAADAAIMSKIAAVFLLCIQLVREVPRDMSQKLGPKSWSVRDMSQIAGRWSG